MKEKLSWTAMPSSTIPFDPAVAAYPQSPVIAEELRDSDFEKSAAGIGVKIDPASNIAVTRDPTTGIKLVADLSALTTNAIVYVPATGDLTSTVNGVVASTTIPKPGVVAGAGLGGDGLMATPLKVVADPASPSPVTISTAGVSVANVPSSVSNFTYDAIGKVLSVAVDGTTPQTVNLSALDDEGTKLVLNGQNLELQNNAGTVLSSTPISQIDAQQLTAATGGGKWTVTLSNGGAVELTCTDIGNLYTAGSATGATELLSKDCKAVTVAALPISPSQLTPGALPSGVTVSAASLPATTNTLAIASGTVTSTVNGVVATAALPATAANLVWGSGVHGVIDQTTGTVAIVPIYNGTNNPALVPAAPAAPLVGKFLQADGAWATIPTPPPVDCAAIMAAFPSAPSATVQANLLADNCTKVKLKRAISGLGTLLNYWVVDL